MTEEVSASYTNMKKGRRGDVLEALFVAEEDLAGLPFVEASSSMFARARSPPPPASPSSRRCKTCKPETARIALSREMMSIGSSVRLKSRVDRASAT